MKVLLVHNYYQQQSGEFTAVEAQLRLLQEAGEQVTVYSKDNLDIQDFNLGQKALLLPRTIYAPEVVNEVRELVRQERPDVAHVHNVFPLISPAVYRVLHDEKIPIVQTVHNFRFLCPNGLFFTHGEVCERCKYGNTTHAVRLKCYRGSRVTSAVYATSIGLHRQFRTFDLINRYIALSKFASNKLVESGLVSHDKISVLGNFLPDPLPSPGLPQMTEPYVIYIGRLSAEKGVHILIDAMAELPELHLKILGDGPQADILKKQVHERCPNNVEFLGHIAGEEKWSLLRGALANIVPSMWYENLPFAILESLAVGTPVIGSNIGSLPYIIEDGKSGALFPPGDVVSLRFKLQQLLAQPEIILSQRRYAREVVEHKYSAEAHYRELMQIYQQVTTRAANTI